MAKNYPDYDDLREQYEAGNISAVDFVTQQSDELTEEYEQFCKDKSIDTGSDQSALAFMDYRDELFEESLSKHFRTSCRFPTSKHLLCAEHTSTPSHTLYIIFNFMRYYCSLYFPALFPKFILC